MIGNDIVDLSIAQQESNWKRKGFLNKLFTLKEQDLVLSSSNPELMVWNLWSRKEAAYKIYNRESGQRVFNPIQFECDEDKVFFGSLIYYTQTQITLDYVYTIALTTEDEFHAIQHLTTRKSIQKNNNIPNWIDKKNHLVYPASVTHHGRFLRVAVLK